MINITLLFSGSKFAKSNFHAPGKNAVVGRDWLFLGSKGFDFNKNQTLKLSFYFW